MALIATRAIGTCGGSQPESATTTGTSSGEAAGTLGSRRCARRSWTSATSSRAGRATDRTGRVRQGRTARVTRPALCALTSQKGSVGSTQAGASYGAGGADASRRDTDFGGRHPQHPARWPSGGLPNVPRRARPIREKRETPVLVSRPSLSPVEAAPVAEADLNGSPAAMSPGDGPRGERAGCPTSPPL
jgi:hypothetical protein